MATQLQTEHGIVRVPTGTWHVDPTHSSVAFEVKHMMIATVHGRFKEFEGTIEAAEEINNSRVYGKVKAASIDTNDETRDAHLRSADFLDVERHPEIRFRSRRLNFGDDGAIRVAGELELRGITRPIEASGTYRLPVTDPYGANRGAIELAATIDRREWGFDWQMPLPDGDDVLDWEVELDVRLELVQEG